ncbi:NADPH dehydrogenase [Paenibacillus sp. CCS19]|uniref:oxidoreductase n=1 Tax=Paenibacillus sp. CCS19 TaxID=3158387 RepID=UPI00256C48AF|nr:NADH:flavin oxidoreductase [Paenibacillus cellulosilyticus]GMK37347.1 NADPH dehydrogenase [Paenibacillus cellulosilyticus]
MKEPLLRPLHIGNLNLRNRLIVAPMQQYQGTPEAYANDYHVNHYSRLARDAGLLIIESTGISADGRLFPNDIGIYSDAHTEPLRRIVDAVHAQGTPIFIQLTHGGRKSWRAAVNRMLAPSPLAYDDQYGVPEQMNSDDIERELENYRRAARRSIQAGFDGIEVHAAHGHLVHQFLSPLSNVRTDSYGGTLNNRVRFLNHVLDAVRSETGSGYPVIVRFSASDYVTGGLTPSEIGTIVSLLDAQIDAVDISSGGLLPLNPDASHDGYQVPYASIIKHLVNIPVIAVGNIHTRSQAAFILSEGLADFVAVGRPLLQDPDFIRSTFLTKQPTTCG